MFPQVGEVSGSQGAPTQKRVGFVILASNSHKQLHTKIIFFNNDIDRYVNLKDTFIKPKLLKSALAYMLFVIKTSYYSFRQRLLGTWMQQRVLNKMYCYYTFIIHHVFLS